MKTFYKSKTMWAAILTAVISSAIPEAKELVENNPKEVMGLVGFIFGLLRVVTDKPLGGLK